MFVLLSCAYLYEIKTFNSIQLVATPSGFFVYCSPYAMGNPGPEPCIYRVWPIENVAPFSGHFSLSPIGARVNLLFFCGYLLEVRIMSNTQTQLDIMIWFSYILNRHVSSTCCTICSKIDTKNSHVFCERNGPKTAPVK